MKHTASSTTSPSDAVTADELQVNRLAAQNADHVKFPNVAPSSVGGRESDNSDTKRKLSGHRVKSYTKPSSSQKMEQDCFDASTLPG